MDLVQTPVDLLQRSDHDPDVIMHGSGECVSTRGVGWVLCWATVLAVLCFAVGILTEFAYSLASEHTLGRAARAGALEATLPRATYRSVCDAVKRRLANRASWAEQLTLSLQRNGATVGGAIRAASGDRMAVTLAVPVRAVVPRWLSAFNLWTGESQIEVRAEREVPGRMLERF